MNAEHVQKHTIQSLEDFDPDGVGLRNGNLFGLPLDPKEAQVHIIPVPWEVTVSYGGGTADGPRAVLEASPQLDLYDPDIPEAWKLGIAMLPIPEMWHLRSTKLRADAERCIAALESGIPMGSGMQAAYTAINRACEELHAWLYTTARTAMAQGRLVGVLGGDHSSPLGFIRALAEVHPAFGILQIDAHADLRVAYEGFRYSHASIMHNALELPQVHTLLTVGLRDVGGGEARRIAAEPERIRVFYDRALKSALYRGEHWHSQCAAIIAELPELVYISFDIDGLDPRLCPNTGTPVAGGLEFEQAMYLLRELVRSGRKIIGFDLCEVAPGRDEWDANVGARVLYALSNYMAVSQGRLAANFAPQAVG